MRVFRCLPIPVILRGFPVILFIKSLYFRSQSSGTSYIFYIRKYRYLPIKFKKGLVLGTKNGVFSEKGNRITLGTGRGAGETSQNMIYKKPLFSSIFFLTWGIIYDHPGYRFNFPPAVGFFYFQ